MLKYIPLKTQLYRPVHLYHKVSIRCTSICLIRSAILLGIKLLSSSRTVGATLYHASHSRFHISAFKHDSWLPISFFIIFQTFSMESFSGEYHGHFGTIISLHSRHVLVLLELYHEARSCIKIYVTRHAKRYELGGRRHFEKMRLKVNVASRKIAHLSVFQREV